MITYLCLVKLQPSSRKFGKEIVSIILKISDDRNIIYMYTHVTPGGPDAAIDEPLPHEPEPENRDNDDPADQQL